jgi:predicted DNA-binding transcriptional regulator AlpA
VTNKQQQFEQRLMTDVELARFLAISVSTVRRWRLRGARSGPRWLKIGGLVRYRVEDALTYLEKCSRGGQHDAE